MIDHATRIQFYLDDEAEIRQAHWQVKPGDFVVDVGACYGLYTLPALAVGARVLALDAGDGRSHTAFPSTLIQIAQQEALPGLLETRRVALYDGSPYPEDLRQQGSTDFDDPRWSTLDAELEGQRAPDWIKIDVEGAELGVLRGAAGVLAKHRPRLIVEDHTSVYAWAQDNRIGEQVVDYLKAAGYRTQVVPYHGAGGYREYVIAT